MDSSLASNFLIKNNNINNWLSSFLMRNNTIVSGIKFSHEKQSD